MDVEIVQYKWAGKFGPFKIKSECNECNLTANTINDMMKNEFDGKNVKFTTKPWLDNIFYCLSKFTWHPPIMIVNGKKFHQYSHKKPLFDRKKLSDFVLNELKRGGR